MRRGSKHIIPAGHSAVRENVLEKGNMIGVSQDRTAWAKGLGLPKEAEFTFFAGCGYQFMTYAEGMLGTAIKMEKVGLNMEKTIDLSRTLNRLGIDAAGIAARVGSLGRKDPYTENLAMAVRVLRKLGINPGYLNEQEPCCGSPLYYAGFVEAFAANARKNHERFKALGVRKIVGLIPACTSALRNVYPRYLYPYDLEVNHFLEIVADRLRESDIRPRLSEPLVVTYHDPCQLSRYLNIVREPREILERIEGVEFREPDPEQCGRWSTCCGGGGLEMSHSELSRTLGNNRLQELLATGADVIATSCPACLMQLHREAKRVKARVRVMDLARILDEALT